MNSEPELIQTQRTLLADLHKLVEERVAAERQMRANFQTRNHAAQRDYETARQKLDEQEQQERTRIEAEYAAAREAATKGFESTHGPLEAEFAAAQQQIDERYATETAAARTEFQEAEWMSASLWEGNQKGAAGGFEQWKHDVQERIERLRTLWEETGQLLQQYRQHDLQADVMCTAEPATTGADPLVQLQAHAAVVEGELARLKQMPLPRLFKGWQLLWPLLIMCGLLCGAASIKLVWPLALALGLAGTLFFGGGLILALRLLARRQIVASYRPLCQAMTNAESLCQHGLAQGAARHQRQVAELEERRKRETQFHQQRIEQKLAAFERRREKESRQIQDLYPPRLMALQAGFERDLREIETRYPRLSEEFNVKCRQEREQLESRRARQLELSQRSHDSDWKQLASNWQHGLQYVRRVAEELNQESRRRFPSWQESSWQAWQPPSDVPEAVRIGEFLVDLAKIDGGLPADERLRVAGAERFTLPALAPFTQAPSLVFRAAQQGRPEAVAAMQNIMLRLLTSLPPGKVRFTIIDPVGLGQNFAAFMRLADHDEMLVTSRIWTEPDHIEQRLADLTAQMETVIQKYLRNEFASIEDYNRHAGEVAEPFRVLVIANFPQNFSEAAAQRLVSIAASGSRCGVRVLASIDRQQPLPRGLELRDLTDHALALEWSGERFEATGSLWEGWQLTLDAPPEIDAFRQILEEVGTKSRDARRVEVPFEFIAPAPPEWWTSDSRRGVNVPLGRAGATRRQPLKLGQGTSQHVLIAGKTGSGKSTLLHALITNLALMYSPDEVELYLIDFKKGVEFKTYAQHALPHARVVAIESEREFGLSVLERLDVELRRRGDLFRDAGVQDLGGYRDQNGHGPLPRILLIVDEFQELFVEDDKLSQEAALLLDRLVRQGRAFGIHALLGSQTLGGAYSLARSTIGQMAVRIALQCSEQDAHLILSEDNSAARLLSRPGEAIYNDSNGLVEGNHPFQVVWLSDQQREEYLDHVRHMAETRGVKRGGQIVFEGNAPAEISKNHLLAELLVARQPRDGRAPLAWLGESVAIKDPTAAEFAPQTGNNLLIVGQRDQAALAILATALISLAAQHRVHESGQSGAEFSILDGSASDASYAGYLQRLAAMLPEKIQHGGPKETAAIVGQLYDEMQRRQESHRAEDPPQYLLVFDLRRFRDLRKDDDDFGFSKAGERPSIAKQFAAILREGPALGIHTLAWCDALSSLQRTLERQSQREFETLVLFQISPSDSSQLIDTPAASKLGPHRALMYREDQARLEKFRPYGLPSEQWLAEAIGRIQAGARP